MTRPTGKLLNLDVHRTGNLEILERRTLLDGPKVLDHHDADNSPVGYAGAECAETPGRRIVGDGPKLNVLNDSLAGLLEDLKMLDALGGLLAVNLKRCKLDLGPLAT